MATSSIFADFTIRDKKTARAFVKALEESAECKRTDSKIEHVLLSDSEAIKERFGKRVSSVKH